MQKGFRSWFRPPQVGGVIHRLAVCLGQGPMGDSISREAAVKVFVGSKAAASERGPQ